MQGTEHEHPPSSGTTASAGTTLRGAIADLGIGSALGLAALALYLALLQPRLYGDGPGLATMVGLGTGETYHHVGYLPLARAVGAVFAAGDAERAVRLTSVLAGALAVGLGYGWLRRLGCARGPAAGAVALWATAPGTLFFATTAEVHMPHAAALALSLFAVAAAPWRRPVLATALVAPCFAALHWTHVSAPLLGLGLVLMVQVGRRPPLDRSKLLLGVGPAWLAALLLAMSTAGWLRGAGFAPFAAGTEVAILGDYATLADPLGVLLHNVAPFALLFVLGLSGAALRLRGRAALAFAALVLPSWAFFSLWGVRERGGYFLPTTLALAWPIALLPLWSRARAAAPLVAGAVVAQLVIGQRQLERWNAGWDYGDRIAVVERALPEGGTLVVPWQDAPSVQLRLPAVAEFEIAQQVSRGMLGGQPPEAMAVAARGLEQLLAAGPVAVDVSFEAREAFHARSGRIEYFRALERALDALYATERFEQGLFEVVRIRPRRER